MKNKLNVSKAQTSHWINVANWAIESGNDGVKEAGRKVLAIAKAGGNVLEHCRSAYEIALRVWTN